MRYCIFWVCERELRMKQSQQPIVTIKRTGARSKSPHLGRIHNQEQIDTMKRENQNIKEELVDIFYWLLLGADGR